MEVNKQKKVNQMKTLDNSRQLILVTTNGYNTNEGQASTFEKDSDNQWNEKLNIPAFIGKNGLTDDKIEGDMKSPTGKYSIGHAFGFNGNPGTELSFKKATSNDVWVDDVDSIFYNTWQEKNQPTKDWQSAEDMNHALYKYGFVINYNTAQIRGKGSAIFMHIASLENTYTMGCVATKEADLIKIMSWLKPSDNPVMILTPESELTHY